LFDGNEQEDYSACVARIKNFMAQGKVCFPFLCANSFPIYRYGLLKIAVIEDFNGIWME